MNTTSDASRQQPGRKFPKAAYFRCVSRPPNVLEKTGPEIRPSRQVCCLDYSVRYAIRLENSTLLVKTVSSSVM